MTPWTLDPGNIKLFCFDLSHLGGKATGGILELELAGRVTIGGILGLELVAIHRGDDWRDTGA